MATSDVFTFSGSRGVTLSGRLERPAGQPRAAALFAHCFTCSKQSLAASRIAAALALRGIATLRFDFTGLGESGGDFSATTFASNVADLEAAAAALAERGLAPALLVGHSLGGAAVLAAAPRLPAVQAVAVLGAPSEPEHVLAHLGAERARIEAEGAVEVTLGGRRITVGRDFIADVTQQRLHESVAGLKRALLILHAPLDEVVGIEHASRLFGWAKHPKSFVSLDRADHLLTRREDADYAAEVIAAWASRYLPAATPAESRSRPEEGEVLVAEAPGGSRLLQQAAVRGHRLTADEPVAAGGADAGPTPYDYLLIALGACTSMTLRLYADRKSLPLERIAVRLRHDKIHAADCADCETKEGKLDRIRREIELVGPLDEAQRGRLLEIADRCPVHRTLESEVRVETRLVARQRPRGERDRSPASQGKS
jgi:putative redox protein